MNKNISESVWKIMAGKFRMIPTVGSVVYYYPRLHAWSCEGGRDLTAVVKTRRLRADAANGQKVFVDFAIDDSTPATGEWMDHTDDPSVTVCKFKLVLDEADSCRVSEEATEEFFPAMKLDQPAQVIHFYDIEGKKWLLRHELHIEGRGVASGNQLYFIKKGSKLTACFMGNAPSHSPHGQAGEAVEVYNEAVKGGLTKCRKSMKVSYYSRCGQEYVVLKKAADDASKVIIEKGTTVSLGERKGKVKSVKHGGVYGQLLTIAFDDGGERQRVRAWKVEKLE